MNFPGNAIGRITRNLRVFGLVQGVFYRESMCREAAKRGVTGWVRNRSDGSLEAMLHGEAPQVNDLIDWARRGPELAQVERIEVSEDSGEFAEFIRLPTV